MLKWIQHDKQNRNSFCLCEITLRTLRFKKSVNLRLIQNRYTPKVPSRGQSLLTTFTYIISIRKIPFPFSNSLITIHFKKSPWISVQKLFPLAFISTKLNTSSLRMTIVWVKLQTWNKKIKRSASVYLSHHNPMQEISVQLCVKHFH